MLLPPGPTAGRVQQAVRFHRDPLGQLEALRAQYGDVFTLRFPEGPMVVVADPDAARAIAEGDPERTRAGAARRAVLPQASDRSSFGADGERHIAAKQRLLPAFAPARIDALRPAIAALAGKHAASWPAGRPFRLLQRARGLSDDIATRLVLGVRDEERAKQLAWQIRAMLAIPGNPPLAPPGGGRGLAGVVGDVAARRRMRPVLAGLTAEYEARRAAGDTEGDDMLGCLLRAPELDAEAAVAEVLPVLLAAQEPMAVALTWLLLRLAREPGLQERWLAEPGLREPVVKETLRLNPPALAMLRELREPAEAAGHTLPAGTRVMNPIVLLHRDREAFPEPEAFRPGRWADAPDPHPVHLPFGIGARRCLGEPLAHAQIEEALPAILERLALTPAWPREERMVLRATILVPQRSGHVRATRRGSAQG